MCYGRHQHVGFEKFFLFFRDEIVFVEMFAQGTSGWGESRGNIFSIKKDFYQFLERKGRMKFSLELHGERDLWVNQMNRKQVLPCCLLLLVVLPGPSGSMNLFYLFFRLDSDKR